MTVRHTDAVGTDFSALHARLGVSRVVVVHGTFVGDDPFGVSEILQVVADFVPAGKSLLASLSNALRERTRQLSSETLRDVGNYNVEFQESFQQLVGSDPVVELPEVAWSSQNHHLARADLAVRLLVRLIDIAPSPDERILLWGHSHAGNAFALLSNLLANERESVEQFFSAVEPLTQPHWVQARGYLANSPSPAPLAQNLLIADFGTPVRYGWDPAGFRSLVHVLHHREPNPAQPFLTHPLFPPHKPGDMLNARYGDWVQAFAIAGTDTTTLPAASANDRLRDFLERSLAEPTHGADTRYLSPKRVRDTCARWKTGTRCHSDGINLLLDYEPSGRLVLLSQPVELSVLGHGVATTVTWLPVHLRLVMDAFSGSSDRVPA